MWKMIEPEDGAPAVYAAVHILGWNNARMGPPSVLFTRIGNGISIELDESLTDEEGESLVEEIAGVLEKYDVSGEISSTTGYSTKFPQPKQDASYT